LPVWTQVQSVLQRTDAILHDLSYYTGAATEIRDVSVWPFIVAHGDYGAHNSELKSAQRDTKPAR